MPAQLEELEGQFIGEKIRFDECMIGRIRTGNGFLTIKGNADVDELVLRQRYRFYGRFTDYKNNRLGTTERQFHFQTYVIAQAHDRQGVIEYLISAGKGNGLGRVTVTKLWDEFGCDAVTIIRQNPRELLRFNRTISPDQCDVIGRILQERQRTEDATIELTNLLVGRGFPKTTARKAIKKWGNRAAEIIRKDPYSLMSFRGCGFKLCDALWIELGHRPDRLKRQALCAWYAVASNTDGHTWFPVEHVKQFIRQNIGSANARPDHAIALATRLAKLSPDHYGALGELATIGANGPISEFGDRRWISEGKKANAEGDLAQFVSNAIRETSSLWPDPSVIDGIDDHQREKLADALVSRVAILGGSPGTGKTYATAMLIKSLLRSGKIGPLDIAIGCPTGKAAVRITEAMKAAGVDLIARTWHSLLGVGQSDEEHGGWSFEHNENTPWPYRVIIGDESSMVDTALMRSIFAARPRGCHVLLVGDVHQLPPVGAGAPLRDMINSQCVGYGELTEIKRNSGGIVEACAAIRDGKPWETGDNLSVWERSNDYKTPLAQTRFILERCQANKYDPVWDCQVLVAVNEKSKLSRKEVNRFLQDELNPNPEIKGCPFRISDKIVCLKNSRFSLVDSSGDLDEVYVANGELAKVLEVEDKSLIAELQISKERIRIPRGKGKSDDGEAATGCNWDLAYGLSTHKSQGSEWPVVIVLVDEYPGARMVCDRSWLYTSISRAKERCFLIGKKASADAMCRRISIVKRKTFLRESIQLKLADQILESM